MQSVSKVTDINLPKSMASSIVTLKNNSGRGFAKDLILWVVNSFENPENIKRMIEERIFFSKANAICLRRDSGVELSLANLIDMVKNAKKKLRRGVYYLKESCFKLIVENAHEGANRVVLKRGALRRVYQKF